MVECGGEARRGRSGLLASGAPFAMDTTIPSAIKI
jgi:hypothetical protein